MMSYRSSRRCSCDDAFRIVLGVVVWFGVVLMVTDQVRQGMIRSTSRGYSGDSRGSDGDDDWQYWPSSSSSFSTQYDADFGEHSSSSQYYDYQPEVTTIEGDPGHMAFASLSFPNGSVWCGGARTYWLVGHRELNERPWCQVSSSSSSSSVQGGPVRVNNSSMISRSNSSSFASSSSSNWERSRSTALDTHDDRHYCSAMDVNRDGLPDIICLIGGGAANNNNDELYLTQPNGTLHKVQSNHGLQTTYPYPYDTRRRDHRFSAVLKNGLGEKEFIFVVTAATMGRRQGGVNNRSDDDEESVPTSHNVPRMFRNEYIHPNVFPYFREVDGPWTNTSSTTQLNMFQASCAVAGDFTGDQRDDLVVCNRRGPALLLIQQQEQQLNTNGSSSCAVTFRQVQIPVPSVVDGNGKKKKRLYQHLMRWRKVRIADVTGDGRPDLVVVTFGQPSRLYIFRGQTQEPYFEFVDIYFSIKLPFASSDVEVLDVNRDQKPDIYVVQVDERTDNSNSSYCERGTKSTAQLPPANNNWSSPPLDRAPDVLLVGLGLLQHEHGPNNNKNITNATLFRTVTMNHSRPGCGWIAHRFDDRTMLLGQGSHAKVGHSLLLEWGL